MTTLRTKAYIEIFISIIIWGIATVVIKLTLQGITPILFLTYRFFISAVIALLFFPSIVHIIKKKKTILGMSLLYAVLSTNISLGLLFLGLNKTSVVNLSLIQAVEPIVLVLLGAYFFRDHMTKRIKIGAAIALFGALLTIAEPLFTSLDGTLTGNILVVGYIVSDIISVLILKELMKKKVDPIALTHFSFLIGFLVFMPWLFVGNNFTGALSLIKILPVKYHLGVIYMAVFSGTIAYALRAKAQKFLTVTEVSLYGYLVPVISAILALVFLSEHITPLFLVGALLIASGVVLAEHKKRS